MLAICLLHLSEPDSSDARLVCVPSLPQHFLALDMLNLQHLESIPAPPLPLSHTLGAASGCLQWQVPSPDMHVQTKNGSSCVRWLAIAGAHPGLAVEKTVFFLLWRLRTMASLIPLQPRAWSCSYSSGISACDTMGYDSLQSDCL